MKLLYHLLIKTAGLTCAFLIFFSGLQLQSSPANQTGPCTSDPNGIQVANAGPCNWIGCDGGLVNCFSLSVNIYGVEVKAECFQPQEGQPQLPDHPDDPQIEEEV